MKITLRNFESTIDKVIVSRGKDYFLGDTIRSLEEIRKGQWVAIVEGAETYKVRVSLKGDAVRDYSCSCPYDMGPVCKHVVAVLCALKAGNNGKAGEAEKHAGKKHPEETFEQVINRLPAKELNKILLKYAEREPDLADYVLAHSALHGLLPDNKQYRRIIRQAINAVRDRHGFIGYWQASEAVRGAEMVLARAQNFLDQGSPENALPVFQVVLEEMVPLLQEADDSNGNIGDVIGEALTGLFECARQAKAPSFRKDLFDYLLTECVHPRYEDWNDWSWELLSAAGEMVRTPQEQERLFRMINETAGKHDAEGGWSAHYNAERGAVIKLAVIERTGSKEDSEAFINQNLTYTALREKAIEHAMARKDYTQAVKLATDGLSQDTKRGLRGLVTQWRRKLLDIFRIQHDKECIRKYALELFIEDGSFEDYDTYKKSFRSTEWPQEAQTIINRIKKSGDTRMLLPEIYIKEGCWKELLDYVTKNLSPGILENYSRHLSPRFPEDIAEAFEKVIIEQLAPPTGRGSYENLARFLRKLKKLGHEDRVGKLITKLSDKYRNRPAMLEELRNI
jgi:PAS domain-containing protein